MIPAIRSECVGAERRRLPGSLVWRLAAFVAGGLGVHALAVGIDSVALDVGGQSVVLLGVGWMLRPWAGSRILVAAATFCGFLVLPLLVEGPEAWAQDVGSSAMVSVFMLWLLGTSKRRPSLHTYLIVAVLVGGAITVAALT